MPRGNAALVSVVIPSYNHAGFVSEAITSVLDQEWPAIDLLVIDDGSTDGSPDLIRGLQEERGGFRFVSRGNRGLIRTLNEGLSMAEGDFFCVLASDDFLTPGSLAVRARFLAAHPEHLAVFGRISRVDAGGAPLPADNRKQAAFATSHDPVRGLLTGEIHIPIHTLLVRKAVLKKIGGFDLRYRNCEDLDVQLLLCLEGQIGSLDTPVYSYRGHGENSTVRNPHIALGDKVRVFRKYLHEVPALQPYRQLILRRLKRQYLQLGRYLTKTGGSNDQERQLFNGAWSYAWSDPRLLWHLLRQQARRTTRPHSPGGSRP